MIFSHLSSVLKVLRVRSGSNELLISASLVLSAGFTQLSVCVDLVCQVCLQEILFSLCCLKIDSNLVKCLFRAKMWLVVHMLILMLGTFPLLLLSDLVLKEFAIGSVLVFAILLFKVLHAVHIVQCRVELMLFSLTRPLHIINLVMESLQGLLIHLTDRFKRVSTLVNSVIVYCERTL